MATARAAGPPEWREEVLSNLWTELLAFQHDWGFTNLAWHELLPAWYVFSQLTRRRPWRREKVFNRDRTRRGCGRCPRWRQDRDARSIQAARLAPNGGGFRSDSEVDTMGGLSFG